MTKAVLFDFDETLQDRTEAFEKYMDFFLTNFAPVCHKKSVKKEKRICELPAMAAMLTGKNGMQIL